MNVLSIPIRLWMRALLFGVKHKIRVETVLDKKQMLFWRKMKNTDRKIDIKTMLFFLIKL